MASEDRNSSRPGVLRELSSVGSRAAAATMRPLSGAVGAAAGAGISLERRAVDRLLQSGELERLIDTFFDSGLFDRLVDRLLASDALWRLVEVIAASPEVTAAISQQGLGFADQVGAEMRGRSRRADDWLERSARKLAHRSHDGVPPGAPSEP